MSNIFKKKTTDLTVGETFGLSLGLTALCFIPYVIAMIAESGGFEKKKKEEEPTIGIEIDDEEETSE